jgi:phosphoheptose isomerase
VNERAHQVVTANLADARATLQQLEKMEGQIEAAAAIIADALLAGHKLLACGNGGSAADASHGGDLTAIGNDYSFADLFSRQLQAFGRPGDALAAFTTSGKSENVFRALVAAKGLGVKTIAFLGRDGGDCAGLADVELLVTGKKTARIQEGHKFLLHSICELVEER